MLENPSGLFYIGFTNNLSRRLNEHNSSDEEHSKFTRKNGPWELVWAESHPTRSDAMNREKQIKRMKSARWIREILLNR
ncbi:MAG: GIY-YIG nuclease family protein [Planctomycetota bacterium]|nr:GIY-YIG nuclease family protein [Planctomycetota bacterium]